MLFRELQTSQNPYSTCKPESPDYVSPFKRTGPGTALDGQPKYDLNQWNPEFFERLHRFLSLASDYGIIVEVVFLSNTYSPVVWSLNPLNAKNNLNDVEEIEWQDYMTIRHPNLFQWQCAHVRKIVEETNQYDNIIYEICNEPGGKLPGDNNPTLEEVNDWQMAIAKLVRETEADLPNKHLIAGQEAFTYNPWEQASDKSFKDFGIDIVNIHPLPNTTYDGVIYDMGKFMSKQLKLRALRDYCLATSHEPKPLNLDEDNVASQYKDYDGWTIHRKRAWIALFCGCHYDYIDFSIINHCEKGTPESQRCIRTWMKHLSEFIHSVDLVRARPLSGWLQEQPDKTARNNARLRLCVEAVLAVEGEDYCIYLADERELTDPSAGDTIQGNIAFALPEGSYKMACFSPATGMYSPWISVDSGNHICVSVPVFQHDIVIRIKREM
jgi:hypothetical protein